MKVLTIFTVLVLGLLQTMAQNEFSVTGKVHQGNRPVESAKVVIVSETDQSRRYISETAADGTFRVVVPPGRYRISATKGSGPYAVGSLSEGIDVVAGRTISVDLEITLSSSISESVTISASWRQSIDEVSKTINVIDGQEMRDRADFTLIDSLRTIPGFRVQQLGGFGKTASIKTRGLRNQDTAVLIDGIRFRDAASITGDATPFLSDFTLTSVSRVEVLRGSGSSLYGTNAIGGVVDFQTPTAAKGFHGQVSGAGGGLGLGRFRGNASYGTPNGKVGFTSGISRTVYTKGIDGNDDANNTNFQARIDLQPATNTSFSGRFFVSDAFVRLNSNPDTFGTIPSSNFGIIDAREGDNFTPDVDDPDDTQRSKFFNGQFVLTQILSSRVILQAFYSGLKTSRKNVTGPLGIGFQSASTSIFGGLIQTANAHIDWTPDSINRITAGYEFEHEKFGNEGSTPSGSGDFFTKAYQSSNTLYVQDLLTLFDGRLNLAGGARVQIFDLKDPKFSLANAPYSGLTLRNPPNAYTFDGAAAYNFRSTGTKLRFHVGNGYRVPSLFERFGTFFDNFAVPNRFVALGDPNLKPEKSISFDGGVEQAIGSKARLTAVYFYTKLIDTIGFGNAVPDIGDTTRPFGGYENQKGGLARGLELSGTLKPTSATDIFASYTFTNSDQRQSQVTGSGVIATLGIPSHQFTLVATQRIQRFWVNFDLLVSNSYLAPIFDTNNFTFQTYVYRFGGNRRGDLTAGYTIPFRRERLNLRLYGTIENVFDHEYFENGFRTIGRTARAGVNFSF